MTVEKRIGRCSDPNQELEISRIDFSNLSNVCASALLRRGIEDDVARVACSRMVTAVGDPAILVPCRRCDEVFAITFNPFTARNIG